MADDEQSKHVWDAFAVTRLFINGISSDKELDQATKVAEQVLSTRIRSTDWFVFFHATHCVTLPVADVVNGVISSIAMSHALDLAKKENISMYVTGKRPEGGLVWNLEWRETIQLAWEKVSPYISRFNNMLSTIFQEELDTIQETK